MSDALRALLGPADLKATLFPPSSRYHGFELAKHQLEDGRVVTYLRPRIVPPPEHFALLGEHAVVSGDRLDNIAANYFGDPELFWRICDANRALRPDELTERAGRRLRITLPAGVAGNDNA